MCLKMKVSVEAGCLMKRPGVWQRGQVFKDMSEEPM
jgi:hypothetical protein